MIVKFCQILLRATKLNKSFSNCKYSDKLQPNVLLVFNGTTVLFCHEVAINGSANYSIFEDQFPPVNYRAILTNFK